MIDFSQYPCLADEEIKELERLLKLTGNPPTLESLWCAMDRVWSELGCSYANTELLAKYYSHPIWTLNGLFIEQHPESLCHRDEFAKYIMALSPTRIADFGGGYGSLARIVAEYLPSCKIDIIEPYPSKLGQDLCSAYKNITFKAQLDGNYDCIIATDVLEHVDDPLKIVEMLAKHVNNNGYLILANCFYPVIKCHLPTVFHFRYSFEYIINFMGLKSITQIAYATVYKKECEIKIGRISRIFEKISKFLFPAEENIKKLKDMLKAYIKKTKLYRRYKHRAQILLHSSHIPANVSLTPISSQFGFDRGEPLDRYYIENFLAKNASDIHGVCLEIADSAYSKKFGIDRVDRYEVLHKDPHANNATMRGNLEEENSLPESAVDVFICTQTLFCFYEVENAVRNMYRVLKPNGVLLCSVPCISQISQYDACRWGDYWRFTPQGVERLFNKYFADVKISVHGNVCVAKSFLDGLAVEDFSDRSVLDQVDEDYPICITVRAKK